MPKIRVYFGAFYGGPQDGLVLQVAETPPVWEFDCGARYSLRLKKGGSEVATLEQTKHVTVMFYDFNPALTRMARERMKEQA